VLRPRLSERLDRGTASKLVLVSAPAGFGKTTLLAEWLAARPAALAGERLVAWLSLDRGDNEPASFWGYVIAEQITLARLLLARDRGEGAERPAHEAARLLERLLRRPKTGRGRDVSPRSWCCGRSCIRRWGTSRLLSASWTAR